MTTTDPGSYTFLPWLRRGAATTIPTIEQLASSAPSRVSLPVTLTVNSHHVSVNARLFGPGDVVGLDARQIARTEPQADSLDFPPNYFAAVDLVQEDLPWLFTPLKAGAQGQLRPWMVLITVRKQPGVRLRQRARSPLPHLEIEAPAVPGDELPDLAESWAWAHVQVTGSPPAGQTVAEYLEASPQLGVARLLSPQRLQPNSSYFACIVPAFLAGVQVGLGIDDDVSDLTPAWRLGADAPASIHLPVYYHFEFGTADKGSDFESLVRAIKPRSVGPRVGQRPIDVGAPGPGLPQIPDDAPGRLLALEGPLRSPATVTEAWPDSARLPFEDSVRPLLDPPDASTIDPIIGPILSPPLYGRWHALQEEVPEEQPHWFRELNLDPRYRTSAGLGTRVVQQDQEELMEEAWAQVDDIMRVNIELRRAQLARAVSNSLKRKHLDTLPPEQLAQLTRPVHARVRLSPQTVTDRVAKSALPSVALSGALRRFARPRGALARRLKTGNRLPWRSIAKRLNDDDIRAAEPRRTPEGTAVLDDVSKQVAPNLPALLRHDAAPWLLLLLAILLLGLAGGAFILGLGALALGAALPAVFVFAGAYIVYQAQQQTAQLDRLRSERLQPEAVDALPPRPDFQLVSSLEELALSTPLAQGKGDSPEAVLFRAATSATLSRAQAVVQMQASVNRPSLAFGPLAQRLSERLDPELTIVARLQARVLIAEALVQAEDPIEPVMAYPKFPRPMYEALAELSEEFIIPGLEHIPPDTATLLETNPPVIQAIMTGLNHEMARELLWREFPNDQRGSYFRQFWDPSGRMPPPQNEAEREALLDVPELHRWRPEEHLGQSLAGGGTAQQLVLVLRGELLRRFPSAMIFAEHASCNKVKGRLEPDGNIRMPLFRGRLLPDVHFLGFELTEADARGSTEAEADQGWYFVVQQQPSEPRFGLDEAGQFADTLLAPTKWNDLTWGHLANEADFASMTTISLAGSLPDTTQIQQPPGVAWGSNGAHMAFITLQRPVRVVIHARLMLPAAAEETGDE